MSEYCNEDEIDWIRSFKRHRIEGKGGLILTGKPTHIDDKIMAIAGAMLRNFMDARVLTVQAIMDHLQDGTMPDPTLVLIPNFVVFGKEKAMPEWRISEMLGWLLKRYAKSKMVIAYVASYAKVEAQWGVMIAEHLQYHFDAAENL
jgi:hypothetical protein